MLKKMIALAAALTFMLVVPVLAAETGSKKPVPFFNGTMTSWNADAKRGAIKDSEGKETSFLWNEKTTLAGTAKVGEHAYVWYKLSKDGTVTATHITFGARLAQRPGGPAKTAAK
jgi:hypothetical protein